MLAEEEVGTDPSVDAGYVSAAHVAVAAQIGWLHWQFRVSKSPCLCLCVCGRQLVRFISRKVDVVLAGQLQFVQSHDHDVTHAIILGKSMENSRVCKRHSKPGLAGPACSDTCCKCPGCVADSIRVSVDTLGLLPVQQRFVSVVRVLASASCT